MLKQNLHQRIHQKLAPKQIKLAKLIQLPTIAFEEKVFFELEENPLLECIDCNNMVFEQENNNKIMTNDSNININNLINNESFNYKSSKILNQKYENNLSYKTSINFYEYLMNQLHIINLRKKEFLICSFIIKNLDKNGYLVKKINDIVYDFKILYNIETSFKETEYLLTHYIQKLDPLGVGSRNLMECLCIQLQNKNNDYCKLAYKIIKSYFDFFCKKCFSKIKQKMNISHDIFDKAINEILKLNPKPGTKYSNELKNIKNNIIPDFNLKIINHNNIKVTLNTKNKPNLKISYDYIKFISQNIKNNILSKQNKDKVLLFIKQKIISAQWFIDAVHQRQITLISTMRAIVEHQKDFFFSGNKVKLKPMILKDIAKIVNLDISTISRVVNSKYVKTPYGTFLLKNFFSEGVLSNTGHKVSNIGIKNAIFDIISKENKKFPLTDSEISKIFFNKGYHLSRRTINKYREQLKIPASRLRRIS